MLIRYWLLFLGFQAFAWVIGHGTVWSQVKYTLSGQVRDEETGEDLVGVRVTVGASAGAITNEYGFFSITMPEGTYQMVVFYPGYRRDTLSVSLNQNVRQDIKLGLETYGYGPVLIEDKASGENVTSTEMSTQTMSLREIKNLPAFMGEVDVIRMIQLLPGVSGVGEGITGYYVRGGQSNQNLVLLDNTTVYNASHLLGFFSVFNADALRDEYKLYKGGIPAQYGTRLSSVLDLHMREGNDQTFQASGGLGLISSRLTLEGPIAKDKASFIVSGRRTYADLFLRLSGDENIRNTQLYFYDFNAKANWRVTEKDRLFISGYFGRDVFGFRQLFGNDWGNATGSLRWNHLFSDKLFANTTLLASDFIYGFDAKTFTGEDFKFSSGIRDYGLKHDLTWFASPNQEWKFGIDVTMHRFNPGVFTPEAGSFLLPFEPQPDHAIESAVYASNEHKMGDRLALSYGLRWSQFAQLGPGEEFSYNPDFTEVLDTSSFETGEVIQFYQGLEPRAAARFTIDSYSSLKASYMRTFQYLHLASNSTASFPWDIWVPSSRHIRPQLADQVSAGYFRNFFENQIEGSVELYYKWMGNQIDFKNGAELLLNPTLETEILIGRGWAYGAEVLIRKPMGRLSGWIGYTLSKSMREIEGINEGNPYFSNNDRRHDVSVVASWQATPRLNVGATWVYGTGRPVTFPVGVYQLDSLFVPYYGERNGSRLPDNHRLDLSVTIQGKPKTDADPKRKLESSWNFSLYNAYGRRNAFSIDFREEKQQRPVPGQPGVTEEVTVRQAYKLYLFRWVPSVTWNFHF
jgi:hypothetical protein